MEKFIEAFCKYFNMPFDKVIQQYNSNKKTDSRSINCIINYKIENNKDIIYKEDIQKIVLKLYGLSQEEFMGPIMKEIKHYELDINNLTFTNCPRGYSWFYYMSTFLEHEPVDIKIALKD